MNKSFQPYAAFKCFVVFYVLDEVETSSSTSYLPFQGILTKLD